MTSAVPLATSEALFDRGPIEAAVLASIKADDRAPGPTEVRDRASEIILHRARLRRIKLGFVCQLTAVGIPMILAGEEFGDEHDLFDRHGNVSHQGGKQVDPVNYSRFDEPDRNELFTYVARLIRLRTSHLSLAADEVFFFHVDFEEGKRVLGLAARSGQQPRRCGGQLLRLYNAERLVAGSGIHRAPLARHPSWKALVRDDTEPRHPNGSARQGIHFCLGGQGLPPSTRGQILTATRHRSFASQTDRDGPWLPVIVDGAMAAWVFGRGRSRKPERGIAPWRTCHRHPITSQDQKWRGMSPATSTPQPCE